MLKMTDTWQIDTLRSICMVAALVTSAPAQPAEWEAVAVKDAELVLMVPGLEADASKFKRKTAGYRQFAEIGYWAGRGGLPQAELVLNHLDPGGRWFFASGRTLPLDEQLRTFYSKAKLQLGATGSAQNVLGELEYQRFILNNELYCVFIRQFLGPTSEYGLIGGDMGKPLGTMLVQGRFCTGRADDLNESTMTEFFAGVGIRSWEVPKIDMAKQPSNITPPASTTAPSTGADGEWKGRMTCENCPGCPGPLEKNVSISIDSGQFELIPDTSYMGRGQVSADGTVRVWWHDQGARNLQTFRFEGRFFDDKIELDGERGPRTCRISLQRLAVEIR